MMVKFAHLFGTKNPAQDNFCCTNHGILSVFSLSKLHLKVMFQPSPETEVDFLTFIIKVKSVSSLCL